MPEDLIGSLLWEAGVSSAIFWVSRVLCFLQIKEVGILNWNNRIEREWIKILRRRRRRPGAKHRISEVHAGAGLERRVDLGGNLISLLLCLASYCVYAIARWYCRDVWWQKLYFLGKFYPLQNIEFFRIISFSRKMIRGREIF